MKKYRNYWICIMILALGLSFLGVAGYRSTATAADLVIDLPAGIACTDFDLSIEITGFQQVYKEFTDKNGNIIRTLCW